MNETTQPEPKVLRPSRNSRRNPRPRGLFSSRSLGKGAAAAGAGLLLLTGAGCDANLAGQTVIPSAEDEAPPEKIEINEAAAENENRFVQPKFADTFRAIEDTTGVETARMFFSDSDSRSLVITDDTDAAKLRGATIAVSQHTPMVVMTPDNRGKVIQLAEDLNAERILTIGEVPLAKSANDNAAVIPDPGTDAALGHLTAFEYTKQVVDRPHDMVEAVARLDPTSRTELVARWQPLAEHPEEEVDTPIPAQSRRDAQMAPVIIATPESPLPSVVNARSYGGQVRVMDSFDPRDSIESRAMVAGLADGPLIALGAQFGPETQLRDRILEIGEGPDTPKSRK